MHESSHEIKISLHRLDFIVYEVIGKPPVDLTGNGFSRQVRFFSMSCSDQYGGAFSMFGTICNTTFSLIVILNERISKLCSVMSDCFIFRLFYVVWTIISWTVCIQSLSKVT